jgi:hypothetical protein
MKKLAARLFLWSMLPLIFLAMYLQTYYANTRPHLPVPAVGRTYELNVHGAVVYLTSFEYFASKYTFYIGIVFGLIGGAIFQSIRKGRHGS